MSVSDRRSNQANATNNGIREMAIEDPGYRGVLLQY
jgi:hypothetical protein